LKHIVLHFWSYEAKCVQLGSFHSGVDLFALKFFLDRVVLYQPFLTPEKQRHWATRRWRLHPSALSRFDTIPECDGRKDRRTGGFAVACTALAKLALQCVVKT